jgi:dTDP-4-amino-4,6-dideoxygalactose transaminase
MDVPLNAPDITEQERQAVESVLRSGQLKGGGQFDTQCREIIESEFGAADALMTTSGTHALEMAALLLDIDPGDEVVMPSYTFTSTATAFLLQGADITFCDIDPTTLTLDIDHAAELVTDQTTAIVPVHYAGISCEMDELCSLAADHDVVVVEDAAQGVNAKYRDQYHGTIGDIGCYSFHGTKSYVAGEGGALILSDEVDIDRAEIIRQKGTNYAQFRRSEVEKYRWVDIGSSYVPSELQTALAATQLRRRSEIRADRKAVYEHYLDALAPIADSESLQLPTIPAHTRPNYHLFYLVVNSERERDALVSHLHQCGIGAAQHYEPLHTAPKGRELGYEPGDLPVTERLAPRLLRLPCHPGVDAASRRQVVDAVHSFYE